MACQARGVSVEENKNENHIEAAAELDYLKRLALRRIFLPGGRYGVEGAPEGSLALQELLGSRLLFVAREDSLWLGGLRYRALWGSSREPSFIFGLPRKRGLIVDSLLMNALRVYGPEKWARIVFVGRLLDWRGVGDCSVLVFKREEERLMLGVGALFALPGIGFRVFRLGLEGDPCGEI